VFGNKGQIMDGWDTRRRRAPGSDSAIVRLGCPGVVRRVLAEAAKNGLPGDHHFFITFDTRTPGIRMSTRLHAQHPAELTIVLQHQFWDLTVTEDAFEVGLSFNGTPERLVVPFRAIHPRRA
jgi:hypothetical protein